MKCEMNEKERSPPLPTPFTIPPNLYPAFPPSVGSYKVDFFCLFLITF